MVERTEENAEVTLKAVRVATQEISSRPEKFTKLLKARKEMYTIMTLLDTPCTLTAIKLRVKTPLLVPHQKY